MILGIFLSVLYVIYLDSRKLCEVNAGLFHRVFRQRLWLLWVILSLPLICLVLVPEEPQIAVEFFILFGLPLYLLRRRVFFASFDRQDTSSSSFIRYSDQLKLDACGVIMVWILSMVVISAAYHFANAMLGREPSEVYQIILSACFSSAVITYLIYQASKRFSPYGFAFNLELRRGASSRWRVFVVPIVLGIIFAAISSFVIVSRKVQPQTPLSDILNTAESSQMLLGFLALAIVIAPLVEEITFRGYFYHVLKKVRGRVFAFVLISLSFGVLHVSQYWGDWAAIFIVCVLGFVLTFVRMYSGKTLASVVMHYVYNAGVTIIPAILLISANTAYIEYQTQSDTLPTEEKVSLLKENIEKSPDFALAYNDLAWIYAKEGIHLQEAERLVETALELEPGNVAFLDTKAEVLTRQGRWRQALQIRQNLLTKKLPASLKKLQHTEIAALKKKIAEAGE